MKKFLVLFLVIGVAHYVAQFFLWAMADAIPRPSTETVRMIGRIGWSVLSFPTFLVSSKFFVIQLLINSVIWGLVGSTVFFMSRKPSSGK